MPELLRAWMQLAQAAEFAREWLGVALIAAVLVIAIWLLADMICRAFER